MCGKPGVKLSQDDISYIIENDIKTIKNQETVLPREFSIQVVQRLTDAGYLAYWAGGCVRDMLLGKEPDDFDVATNATPDQVRELFGKKRTLAVGESFGVIIVLGPKLAGQVEVATFRSEGEYVDGRRPESVAYCTPEEDAHRRDFTINGMFYDPIEEQIHDFVGGQEDLARKIVRAIGDPHDRMSEDKLRLLRAIRFTASLEFELDSITADAVRQMASQIVVVSTERIAQELKKMLAHPQRARAMQLCEELDLLHVILPEVFEHTVGISFDLWTQRLSLLSQIETTSFEVAMAAMLRDVPAPVQTQKHDLTTGTVRGVCQRLKLSNQETKMIDWLVSHRDVFDDFHEWSLADKKRLVVKESFAELLQLERTATMVNQKSLEPPEVVDKFLSETPPERICPPELLDGRQLIELGYKPGPQFQVWLNAVRTAQLNEEITTTGEAIETVRQLSSE